MDIHTASSLYTVLALLALVERERELDTKPYLQEICWARPITFHVSSINGATRNVIGLAPTSHANML